jgi:hypothetical protein
MCTGKPVGRTSLAKPREAAAPFAPSPAPGPVPWLEWQCYQAAVCFCRLKAASPNNSSSKCTTSTCARATTMSLTNLTQSQVAAMAYQSQLQAQKSLQNLGHSALNLPFDTSQILPMLGQHGMPDLAETYSPTSSEKETGGAINQLAKRQRRYECVDQVSYLVF